MLYNNIKIVLINAKCCIGELAAKVAKLYAIGDKCANSELKKLKILEDRYKSIEDYYCSKLEILFEPFNTNVFTDIPQLWERSSTNFIWDAKKIAPNLLPDPDSGLIAYSGLDATNTLYRDGLLTIDKRYVIEFDFYYDSDSGQETPPDVQVFLGTTLLNVFSDVLSTRITLEGICEGNTTFTIQASDNYPLNSTYAFDNIRIYQRLDTCLTEDQIDIMIHDLMRDCDICDCQLNLNNK